MRHPYQKTHDVVADVQDVLQTLLTQTERRSCMWSRMAEPADAQLDRLVARNLRRALTLSQSFCVFSGIVPTPNSLENFSRDITPIFNEIASLVAHAAQDHTVSPLHEKIAQANMFVLERQRQRIHNAITSDVLMMEQTAAREDHECAFDIMKMQQDYMTRILAMHAYMLAFSQEMTKGMVNATLSLMTPPKPRPTHLKLVVDNTF